MSFQQILQNYGIELCDGTVPEESKSVNHCYERYIYILCIRDLSNNLEFEDIAVYTLANGHVCINIMNEPLPPNTFDGNAEIKKVRNIIRQALTEAIQSGIL